MKTRKLKIETWLSESVYKGKWQDFYDLHIDEVFGKSSKKNWIRQALLQLDIVHELLDTNKFEVVLSVPLEELNVDDNRPISFYDLTPSDLSSTPPSTYIMEKNCQQWRETFSIENIILKNAKYCFFLSKQIDEDDGVIYRWVHIKHTSDVLQSEKFINRNLVMGTHGKGFLTHFLEPKFVTY